MSGLYHDKYRIPSARLPGWNYGSEGMYFVTVCTAGRRHFFGDIHNGCMCLSTVGAKLYQEWLETPALRPDMNVQPGEFVVMPNHFHAILIIGSNDFNMATPADAGRDAMIASPAKTMYQNTLRGDATYIRDASIASLHGYKNMFAPQAKNLASVMRGFKSAVTSFANEEEIPFGRQARYHDHIIRSYEEYQRISGYILANIDHWKEDCFYF